MGFIQTQFGTSLDSTLQSSLWKNGSFLTKGWDKKQKRAFHCGYSGLKRCRYNGKQAFFLTLTSSPLTSHDDLRHDWDVLVKRIRQQLKFDFHYIKVETFEGYGVIHALYHSAFDGWRYADIHSWLSKTWGEIHKAPIVWNTVVGSTVKGKKFSLKKCASYLCQYMSDQKGFFRRSTSAGWIFPRYRYIFVGFVKKFGFKEGLRMWDNFLCNGYEHKLSMEESVQFPIGL